MNALEVLEPFQNAIVHGFFVFVRVCAISALLPGFGEQSVSVRLKILIALAIALIVAPVVEPISGSVLFFAVIFTESFWGLIFGLGIRLFILAMQTAGTIAAQSTSLSQILGGASIEPIPAMGYLLVVGAICLAMILGLHVKVAQFLILTFQMVPIGQPLNGSLAATWGVERVSHAFALAFSLAVPFVILSILYNLALGAINRAMPLLMVAFVGAPFITFAGLFLLFASSTLILNVWAESLFGFLERPWGER